MGMFLPVCKITNDFENTLFTVAGIMFSIGLGLTVTSSTHDVLNKEYIKEIRTNISVCQSKFNTLFLLLTLFYLSLSFTDDLDSFTIYGRHFSCNLKLSFSITSLYSIFYFIRLFHSIQKFNDDLEDKIKQENCREQ